MDYTHSHTLQVSAVCVCVCLWSLFSLKGLYQTDIVKCYVYLCLHTTLATCFETDAHS